MTKPVKIVFFRLAQLMCSDCLKCLIFILIEFIEPPYWVWWFPYKQPVSSTFLSLVKLA